MKMRKLALLALALMMLSSVAALAQDETPEYNPGCSKVLKIGLEKFMEAYGEATQDYSTAGQKRAFEQFVDCKKPANIDLANRTLNEAKLAIVDAVRLQLNDFGNKLWELKYEEAGGGTMWGLISVSAYAEREVFMETLIKSLAAPDRRSPRSRRAANANLARIQRWLESPGRKPFTEGHEAAEVAAKETSYKTTLAETRATLEQLRSIIKSLPDRTAAVLAAKMSREARNALVDEG